MTSEKHQENISALWQDRKKRRDEALTWLCETFPEAFNFKQPKPLKVGILKDIVTRYTNDISPSRSSLKMALSFYTSRLSYLATIIQGKQRFDLEGHPSGEITENHQKHAQELLTKRKKAYAQGQKEKTPDKEEEKHQP